MKISIIAILLMALSLPSFAATHVKSYAKKNGTYVSPHMRSGPDHSKFNNYSTKNNVNPYTGKMGHKDPYK